MPLWLTAVVQIPLWACLLGVPIVAAVTKGNGPVRDLGLRTRPVDAPVGLAIGVAAQLVLVPAALLADLLDLRRPGRVGCGPPQLTDRATDPFGVVMLFLIVGIGAPVAEEIFFRGLAQRSLDRRWGVWVALFGTAASSRSPTSSRCSSRRCSLFGLMLGAMVLATRRLGTSIWAHLGFNMVAGGHAGVGHLPAARGLVVIGLLGLAACAYLVRSCCRSREIRTTGDQLRTDGEWHDESHCPQR